MNRISENTQNKFLVAISMISPNWVNEIYYDPGNNLRNYVDIPEKITSIDEYLANMGKPDYDVANFIFYLKTM